MRDERFKYHGAGTLARSVGCTCEECHPRTAPVDEYASLTLNSEALPYATYADCPASSECEYCDDGAEYAAHHSHEMYESREGASLHTADELVDIFLTAVEWYAAPWKRPDYCPRDVSGWMDDPDDSQALHDCVALGESALGAVGLYVIWNDGYVIERVTEHEEQ